MALIGIIFVVYKIPFAFAIGVAFLAAGRYCCSFIVLFVGFIYMLSTSGGIIMMMHVEKSLTRDGDLAIIIIQGLACGFLIYFACSDLIANEFFSGNEVDSDDEIDHST